jgi:Mlc titration factor MtfA (ptsG expression regulator)
VIILSWDEVLRGGRDDDFGNVVFHEFAHQFDLLEGGEIDGTPPLETADQHRRWREVTDLEYRHLKHRCKRGLPTFLDCYAATDRREFFAVTTEIYLTFPHAFRRRMPDLYGLLGEVYRQDPATYLPDEDVTDEAENESEDGFAE